MYELQLQGTHGGHQILLFVYGGDIRSVRFFADDLFSEDVGGGGNSKGTM
jgi:hypothetical protein